MDVPSLSIPSSSMFDGLGGLIGGEGLAVGFRNLGEERWGRREGEQEGKEVEMEGRRGRWGRRT